ncbi:MAG: polysaccharide biosynthesis/export family protein [Litorimonas sp.]
MLISRKIAFLAASCAVIALTAPTADAQSRYGQGPAVVPQHTPHGVPVDRYGKPMKAGPKKYKNIFHKMRGQKHIAYQTPPPPGMFQQWVDWEPEYTLVAGDQLDIVVSSAPELSRTLTVGPDGRVVMPMSRPIMAAGRTFGQVQNELMGELGKQLRDPTIAVTPRAYAPEQIYVGGQVGQPGTYTIPGRIGALEGILMAGGLRPTARSRDIAILRRAPNGGMMMRSVNIRGGMLNIREYNDNVQLRRGDIIYVPQNTLGEIGTFMDGFRRALPVDFNLSYQFGSGNDGGTTVISP